MRPDRSVLKRFGRHLREARRRKGYSINLLAGRAGVSPRTVEYIEENGREPSLSTAIAIAQALSTSVEALWNGTTRTPGVQKELHPEAGSVYNARPHTGE